MTIWHHNARYVQREKPIGESFILGKCSDLNNSLQEELCLKGVLLAKNQNLSNQLDSLKDTNTRLIDYVKSISKKVGTANSGKEFLEITENNKPRKIKEFKSKVETAIGL